MVLRYPQFAPINIARQLQVAKIASLVVVGFWLALYLIVAPIGSEQFGSGHDRNLTVYVLTSLLAMVVD